MVITFVKQQGDERPNWAGFEYSIAPVSSPSELEDPGVSSHSRQASRTRCSNEYREEEGIWKEGYKFRLVHWLRSASKNHMRGSAGVVSGPPDTDINTEERHQRVSSVHSAPQAHRPAHTRCTGPALAQHPSPRPVPYISRVVIRKPSCNEKRRPPRCRSTHQLTGKRLYHWLRFASLYAPVLITAPRRLRCSQ